MDTKTINDAAAKIEDAARLLWNEAKMPDQEKAARMIINGAQIIARLTSVLPGGR